MSSTNSTNGQGDAYENPQKKKERERMEKLNQQYMEHHGLSTQPDDTTEQDEAIPASSPESVDLGTSKDVGDLIDATREQMNKGLSADTRKNLSSEEAATINLDDDSAYDLPVFPNSNPPSLEDSESDSEIPVFNADSDAEVEFTASSLDEDDDTNTMPELEDESEGEELTEEEDNAVPDDNDDDKSNEIPETEHKIEGEESANEKGEHAPKDDKEDSSVESETQPVVPSEQVPLKKKKKPSQIAAKEVAAFTKNNSYAAIPGVVAGVPAGAAASAVLGSWGLLGGSVFSYAALPIVGAANPLIDGVRSLKGSWNYSAVEEDEKDVQDIAKYLEIEEDLINEPEEVSAVQILEKLGAIDARHFPLFGTEDQYAMEVLKRISPIFEKDYPEASSPVFKKALGSEWLGKYEMLTGKAASAAPDTKKSKNKKTEEEKKLSALSKDHIRQISAQLGRMLYTYHLKSNYLGRALGLTAAAGPLLAFGGVLPLAVAGTYEGSKFIWSYMRDKNANFTINKKGEIVNTADGKKDLALPLTNQEKKEAKAKPLKPEKFKELKEERDEAKKAVEKTEEQIVALDEKIQTDTEMKAKYDTDIKKIENKKVDRQLTEDQQIKIDKLQMEKEEWEMKKRNAQSDSEDTGNAIIKLTREIQEKIAEVEPKQKKITDFRNEKLPHLDAIDTLEIEKKRLQQEENNPTSAARIKAIDLEVRSLQFQIDSLDRKIKVLNEEIKEIGIQHKQEWLDREKKAKRKADDDVAFAERKIAEAQTSINRITAQGTSDKLTKAEEAEIEVLKEKIAALKLSISEQRKAKLLEQKTEESNEYKKLKDEYVKQEGIADAAAEEKPETMTGKAKKAVTEKVLKFAKDEVLPIAGWATGSGVVGATSIAILNTVSTASQYLVNPVTGAVSAAAFATAVYIMNRIKSSAGARSVDTTPDTK